MPGGLEARQPRQIVRVSQPSEPEGSKMNRETVTRSDNTKDLPASGSLSYLIQADGDSRLHCEQD